MVDAPVPPPSDGPDTASPAEGPRPRVLIVDDVFDNRAVLGRRFERRGYEVIEAESGTQGLDLIAADSFDVVLLDWMMPDIEGIEVLRRIRETHADTVLPVIMVTAKTQSEDIVQALTLGANDYIAKPVDFAVALARVQTQVGRKRAEEQVRAANEALSRANESLEGLVAERTAELVDTNAQLRIAMEEAQAANRSKDEFLANMSHELRTPLNGVIGMAQVLASTSLTEPQSQMVEVINTSAEGLQAIVADLLDIVDLSSGRLELAPRAVKLDEIVDDVAAEYRAKVQAKGLAFRLEMAGQADGQVQVDPARLRQVLSALLSNALKFTESGEVAFSVVRAGERVLFEVLDTGIGFDPEVADRLFRRFEQADGSLTRRFGGVGMGLAICQELIAQMGGSISAEGRPGEGATFRIELPLPILGAVAPGETATESPTRVLCVEDHPINRKVVELIMQAAGVGFQAVENGAEAVEAFKAQQYDVILMDMQMPVMDGLAATRAIRAFEAASGRAPTPVVMVTAHGFPEHVNASQAAGADRHLTKPVNAAELVSVIHEVVTARKQAAAA